jgi:mRNA interferase MazF
VVASRPRVPDRGDIVWITLAPQTDHEQAGRRPAVVLSPAAYNRKVGLALMCPITSRIKGYPFEVAIPAGLPVTGVVLSDQIKSLDWRVRRAERICILPRPAVTDVLQKLGALLA